MFVSNRNHWNYLVQVVIACKSQQENLERDWEAIQI